MKNLIFLGLFFTTNCVFAKTVLTWGIDKELFYHIRVAKEFKSMIEARTNGEVTIEFKLYNERENPQPFDEIMRSGKYDINQAIISNFQMRAPETKVWEIPYLFESFEHIEKYSASPNGQKVIEKINSNNPDYQIVGYSYSGGRR